MLRCSNCGFKNDENCKYCQNCGLSLIKDNTENLDRNDVKNNKDKFKQKNKKIEISALLAIFLPGISYFYLEQWYRGILFFLFFPILFFYMAIKAAVYTMVYPISINETAYIIVIISLIVYVIQIYDIIQLTRKINNGDILF